MGIKVRKKDGGKDWWIFIHHKSVRKSKKIGPDKKEAERVAAILRGEIAAGDLNIEKVNNSTGTFETFSRKWLDEVLPLTCRESTQESYRSIHRLYLKTAPFYRSRIDQITKSTIKGHLYKIRKKRTQSTVEHIRNAISNVFKIALDDEIIGANPCSNISIPVDQGKPKTKLQLPLDVHQIEILLKIYSWNRFYPLVLFLCRTGCRAGEAAALKWSDLDLDRRKATIQRSITRGRINRTKTGKTRRIDLSPQLVAELRKQRLRTKIKGEWVFQNTVGNFVDMNNFRDRSFYPMLERAGLPRVRVHDLRHSFATFLIQHTGRIYYAQKQLGHSSIQVTVDRYGHLLDEYPAERLVDKLDTAANTSPNRTLSALKR